MNEEQINKLFEMLGEIKGTQEQILKKQDRVCSILDDHEVRLREAENTISKHSTYFKIMGGSAGFIAMLGAAWSYIKSLFHS
ncbi:hypothetical protein DRP05_08700 [Archaeoglobales archaeon]|nr:MAG: hypothetical protein DRP05_08700 [Archaeoglobales archaeon]